MCVEEYWGRYKNKRSVRITDKKLKEIDPDANKNNVIKINSPVPAFERNLKK
jgi:hypothetical protein